MNKKVYFFLSIFSLLALLSTAQITNAVKTVSPNKSTILEIGVDANSSLKYRVIFNNKPFTAWSAMGINFNDIKVGESTTILSTRPSTHAETFSWPLGENDRIENNYASVILHCKSSGLNFYVEARVYNGSVAFRYGVPSQPNASKGGIKKELTDFTLLDNYMLYQYHQESIFSPVSLDTFNTSSDLPLTLTNGQLYLSIGEADNLSYTKVELKRGDLPHSLKIIFPRDSVVKTSGSFLSPWRTISVSLTAIGLHDFSELYIKLAVPFKGKVPAWIKPGKLIRSQLTTQSGLDCIDFAVKNHLRYIMFDAGWYGEQYNSETDPIKVIPEIDMPAVIQHGKEKGIGVILYVNYIGLKIRLDTVLHVFKKWGVEGIKFGFVDGVTQDGLTWLSAAIKKVNDNGFILDVHDNYKPTGLSRTFPALLTQEGIRGDENSPDAFHTTVLPFTRFLAGPADFTFCYPNEKNSYSKNLLVTKGQQLALTVAFFSPLQSMFWYGQPKDYTNEGEIAFFKLVPTVWNESHYLAGDIGKNISVARRNGANWFMGNVAGLADWNDSVSLQFLDKSKNYTATIYEDDGAGSIRKRIIQIKKNDSFKIDIKAKGGQAVMISPVSGK
jgi:alpha-glucosidase